MGTTHDSIILLRNTMTISEGHLAAFKEAVESAVGFTEEHGPQLMVEVFIDEERMEATSFQIYENSEAMLRHWELSDPYIQEVNRHSEPIRGELFGNANDEVLHGLEPHIREGRLTVTPHLTGFGRFAPKADPEA